MSPVLLVFMDLTGAKSQIFMKKIERLLPPQSVPVTDRRLK